MGFVYGNQRPLAKLRATVCNRPMAGIPDPVVVVSRADGDPGAAGDTDANPIRCPGTQGANGVIDDKNLLAITKARHRSPQQVCLAWELARSPVIIPIPGASRPETIVNSAGAAALELSAEELARLG